MNMNDTIKKIQEASFRSAAKIKGIVCGKKPLKDKE